MQITVEYLKSRIPYEPVAMIILGTGLGALAESDYVQNRIEIPYAEIPGFVNTTAPSHQGKLIAGHINGTPVIILKGRFHFYEGHSMQQVVYPVRIARLLGVKYLFVTNAAGSLNEDLLPGQIVRITDHINFMGTNPLIGSNIEELGERFPSMHNPYDVELGKQALEIANRLNISVKQGVYCAVSGPSLETVAECMMLKRLGADLVGMSTVPEVIAAIHSQMKVFAVSVVTNLSNIFHSRPHSQEEIRQNADRASNDLILLFNELLGEIEKNKNERTTDDVRSNIQ